ncbi:hypothetical protein DdX_16816 [Ditylenchus destructor]|uniref:Lipoprotein n=1 Tax=Ditylenchus destructor TaxID=166010 RepID=A0AAD4QZS4_9BILA|nr:hypothetical protein DdX_16816 [Ditylenchus destructor]
MSRLPQILLSILTFTAILNFSTCHTDEQKDNAAKNRVWTLEVANSVRKYDPSFGVHNQKHKSFKGDELRLHQPTGFPEYDLFKGAVDYYEKQRAKPGDEPEPEEAPKKRNIKLPAVFTTKVLNPKNVDSKDFIALIAAFGHTYLDAGIWNWLNKEPKVLYKFLTKKGYTIEGGSGKKSERTGDRKELNSADIEVLKEMLDKAKAFIKEESMILGLPVETEKKEDQFLSDDLLTEGLTSSSVEMDRNEVLEPTKIYPSLSPAVRFPNYNITPKITKDKEKHNKEKLALLVKSLYLLDLGLYLSRRAMNPKKPLPKKATVANPTVENPMEFFVYVEINEMIKKIRDLDPKKENKEVWGRLCVYDRDNPNAKQLKQSVEITIPEMLRTRKIKTGQELVDVMHMIVNPLRLHTLR